VSGVWCLAPGMRAHSVCACWATHLLLAACACWLLVACCLLLAACCWLLAAGCQGDAGDNDEHKVFVGGVSFKTDADALWAAFEPHGPLLEAKIVMDRWAGGRAGGRVGGRAGGWVCWQAGRQAGYAKLEQ
jgi:hypothetical protein